MLINSTGRLPIEEVGHGRGLDVESAARWSGRSNIEGDASR